MLLRYNHKFTKVLFLVLSSAIAFGQNPLTKELTLQEALDRTVANNRQIKIADYEYSAALTDVEKMKSIYLPQVQTSIMGSANNLPLNVFGSKLQQGAIEQADFIPSSLNDPDSYANIRTQVLVRQPILNLDAKAMKDAVIAQSNAYSNQVTRTKYVLKNQVSQAYLQLQLMYEVKDVLQQAKGTATANLKLTKDNMDAGYIQYADVLSVEVRINEIDNQINETENNIQNISDQLAFLMGNDYGEKFVPADELIFQDQSAILVATMPTSRSDIQAMESQVVAHKHMLDASQKTNLPRVNAFGSYELNNNFAFDESQHGYMLGIEASWLIFNGQKNKSATKKAEIELQKSETQLKQLIAQNNLEFEIAKRKMTEAQDKINLTKKAIEQSKESLRIKTDRYAEGLEKTTDILIAETKVSQKEMDYAEAIYQYKLAYAQLQLILEQS